MEITQSIGIFRALSDSSRLLIINSLLTGPHYIEELANRLNLSVSTVSFHVNKLEDAGLIFRVKEQYYTMLHLNKEILGHNLKDMISFIDPQKSSSDERLRAYAEKVISTYVRDGFLEKLPSQHKKRMILLEAFLTLFKPEKIYPEKDVDSIINRLYEDHCTIRRLLIDEKMMFRKKGNYVLNEKYQFQSILPEKPFTVKKLRKKKNSDGITKMIDKTKIKNQYKLTPRPMGVYKLTDKVNNKIYLGISKNLKAIFNRHRFELNTGMHGIKEVQDVWNSSGEKGIKLEVMEYLKPVEDITYNYTDDLNTLLELCYEKLKEGKIPVFILNGTMISRSFTT